MLVRTNMEDLRETTHVRHYELYRRNKLQEMGFTDNESMRFASLTKKFPKFPAVSTEKSLYSSPTSMCGSEESKRALKPKEAIPVHSYLRIRKCI